MMNSNSSLSLHLQTGPYRYPQEPIHIFPVHIKMNFLNLASWLVYYGAWNLRQEVNRDGWTTISFVNFCRHSGEIAERVGEQGMRILVSDDHNFAWRIDGEVSRGLLGRSVAYRFKSSVFRLNFENADAVVSPMKSQTIRISFRNSEELLKLTGRNEKKDACLFEPYTNRPVLSTRIAAVVFSPVKSDGRVDTSWSLVNFTVSSDYEVRNARGRPDIPCPRDIRRSYSLILG